ncbi:hypothetical protein FRC03_003003 [Tulasnella sp. 419]|nr:hypothetical protein FRC03_003003 [Tulasnella sp. 419]
MDIFSTVGTAIELVGKVKAIFDQVDQNKHDCAVLSSEVIASLTKIQEFLEHRAVALPQELSNSLSEFEMDLNTINSSLRSLINPVPNGISERSMSKLKELYNVDDIKYELSTLRQKVQFCHQQIQTWGIVRTEANLMNVRDDMIALFKQQEASIRLIQEKLGVQVPGLNEERKATLENIEEELSERLSIREANALSQQGLARMQSRNDPQVAPSIKSAKYSLRSLSSSIIEKGYLKKRIKEISNTLPQVRDNVFRQNTIGWLNQFKKLENITCDMNVDDAIQEAVRILKVFRSTKKVTYISAAKDLIRLGEALRALDMPEQASVMYEWGVHLCCELAAGRGSKMMELVKFLGNLVASFRSNQRLDDAWGVMDQAVEIGGRLPQQEQKAYLAALAPLFGAMEQLETVEQFYAWVKTGKKVAIKYHTLAPQHGL